MRSTLIGLTALLVIGGAVWAADWAAAKPQNNVCKLTAAGERTAVCGCGKEFLVTEKSPAVEAQGTTLYCCSPECHEHASKATAEESAKMMESWSALWAKRSADLWSNAKPADKDGAVTATCACGKEFKLTESTPVIVENGVALHCCSDVCHAHLMDMKPADRLTAELALIKKDAAKPAATPVNTAEPKGK